MVAVTQAGTAGVAGSRGSFRLTWRGSEVKNALDSAIQDVMDATAAEAKAEAQALCPVDTGLLRSSIFAEVDARGGSSRRTLVLGANAPYALFVELGTSKMRAQPFIRPAIDRTAPRLTQNLRSALRSV